MQTYVSVELTILCYVWFMQAEGFENWCNYDPSLSLEPTNSPNSYILKYFLGTILLFVIGYVQYLVRIIFKFIIPLPSQDFVDLCSVTNISVFIFDSDIHGFYIHGESPAGQADVS